MIYDHLICYIHQGGYSTWRFKSIAFDQHEPAPALGA